MKNKYTTILIVEDHKPTRDGMALLLGEHYRCTAAASAEEAIGLIAPLAFNLVITDIKMPGASGVDLCAYIHQMCPDTVVIAVSGLASIRDQAAVMRQGALYYIEKPFDTDKLFALVASALRCQALVVAKHCQAQKTVQRVRPRHTHRPD
jgi:DNA-binding NtrC family response regulator